MNIYINIYSKKYINSYIKIYINIFKNIYGNWNLAKNVNEKIRAFEKKGTLLPLAKFLKNHFYF